MFKNYLITAYRNIMRHKLYSLINIGGLSIGLAACILIFLFVKDELFYDDWGNATDQLYRVEASYLLNESDFSPMALSPGRLRGPLAESYASEIEAIARFRRQSHVLKRNNDSFIEPFIFADNQLFDIFDIKMVSGNRADVFRDNRSVIIDESMALKYFGSDDPVGQLLDPDDVDYSYKIVGVMKDLPENTHLEFSFVTLFDPERYIDRPWIAQYWLSSNVYTYVKLAEGASAEAIEQSIPDFLSRNVIRSEQPGLTEDPSVIFKLRLIPVEDIHLYSTGRFQMKSGGDIKVVYSFTVIALLILFIASINFINLSTARASIRAREIALRKVVGASRGQLIVQFLGEAGLMVLIALIVALTLVEFALPWFSEFVAKLLSLEYGSDPLNGLVLAGLLVVVGIGAGMLPAIQITRFRPADVLRANKSSSNAGGKLRVVLVTIQFAISIGLIATTMIVYAQTEFTSNTDLGFETKDRLMLDEMNYRTVEPVADTIRAEIERLPGVLDTSYTAREIPLNGFIDNMFQKVGESDNTTYRLETVAGDNNFLEFFDAELITGRMFSRDIETDQPRSISDNDDLIVINTVVNRATVHSLGLGTPEEAIGQSVTYADPERRFTQLTIIGVVEDMLMRSLKDEAEPLLLHVDEENHAVLNIHIMLDNQLETVEAINMIWKKHVPSFPVDLTFMDDNFGRLYEADVQRGMMFGYFSIFAILVSCLGLFGLSAFTAEQKTKEIGIRKVFGARNISIINLLIWQFSKPILVANFIAWPVAWYIMQDWLSGYAYRIDITIVPFLLSGLLALAIACLTISVHAWRIAQSNPIHALRHE